MIALARKPTKQEIRAWLKQQIAEKKPPPSSEEIRRQLWHGDFLNSTSAECAR
jgi:hypothetical protein